MLWLAIFALLPVGFASIIETFEKNGILYEEIGNAKLMFDTKKCLPRRFDIGGYINNMAANETSDIYSQTIWKTTFHNIFAEVCSSFNLSNGLPVSDAVLRNKEIRDYLIRLGLNGKLQKFHYDLWGFFLYNRIPSAFFQLLDKKWIPDGVNVFDYSAKAVAFPERCDHELGAVDVLLCSNFDELSQDATLYAIAHVGQFMAEGQVYVYQEVPEYVVVDENGRVMPVDMKDCKVMNISTNVCMHRAASSSCDVTTMSGCDIIAQRTTDGFTSIRKFGAGNIVATNLPDSNLNGTTHNVSFPIFTYHTLYRFEIDGDKRKHIPYPVITPVEIQASFPGLSYSTKKTVLSTKDTVRLYHVTRKGVPMLSNQSENGSVWENVKDFFLHLI